MRTASGQKLGIDSIIGMQIGRSKQSVQGNRKAAVTLLKKLDGDERFFIENVGTPFDNWSAIKDAAFNDEWTKEALEAELRRFHDLSAKDKSKYKFPKKNAKTSPKGGNKFSTLLSGDDLELDPDTQHLIILMMLKDQASERVWRQFFAMIKADIDMSDFSAVNEKDARDVKWDF